MHGTINIKCNLYLPFHSLRQGSCPQGQWAVRVSWTDPVPRTKYIHDCKWDFEAFLSLYAVQMAVPMVSHLHPCKLKITTDSLQNFQISLSISQRFCLESFLSFFSKFICFGGNTSKKRVLSSSSLTKLQTALYRRDKHCELNFAHNCT